MKFSEHEIQMAERLRRRQRTFRRWRFLLLAVYALCFIGVAVASLVLSAQVSHLTSDGGTTAAARALAVATRSLVVAFAYPLVLLCMVCSAFGLGYTISIWHGEPKTELLLRLIDELQNRDG
jgi:hypothetical protein